MRTKILTIVGARPQFIKAAPMSKVFLDNPFFEEILVHTGQHFDKNMSDIFFEELKIPTPKYNLGVHSCAHTEMTAQMMQSLEKVVHIENPAGVLVYGDTNSTLASALVATKNKLPLFHVEAGLRCIDRTIPEEINRRVTDVLSDLLFCPTPLALENARKENLAQRSFLVGDVMFDLFKIFQGQINEVPAVLKQLGLSSKGYHLLTIHREVNTTNKDLFKKLINFVSNHSGGAPVLFLVHPRTKALAVQLPDNFMVSPPQGYKDMVHLTSNARTIFTDSGGLQKEACFARVPCVTLYYETTWEETIQSGWNVLWENVDKRAPYSSELCDYGDGHACEKIHEHLRHFYET